MNYNSQNQFHIQWHITEKCNLDCIHCYKEPFREELELEQLKLIAEKIMLFAKNWYRNRNAELIPHYSPYGLVITITGGEPFLKESVYDIADYIDKFDVVKKINFISNGTIIPDLQRIKKLNKFGILYISLESIDETVNDKIRGEKVFDKVTKNLKELNSYDINLGIMTTLLRSNIENLISQLSSSSAELIPPYFEFLHSYKNINEIIFERFIPVGNSKGLKNEVVPRENLYNFYHKIAECCNVDFNELKKYKAIKLVRHPSSIGRHQYDIFGAVCIGGKEGCAVLCDGSVYPCRRLDIPLGNLLKQDLVDLLVDEKTVKILCKADYLNCFAMGKSMDV